MTIKLTEEQKKRFEALFERIRLNTEILTRSFSLPMIRFQETMRIIRKGANRYEKITRDPKYRQFKKNWEWLVYINIPEWFRLFRIYKRKGNRGVWKSLNGLFRDKKNANYYLKHISTSKYFKNKLKIIEKALKAHRNKDFELSIPTILPITEGIIWEVAQKKGIIEDKLNSKKLLTTINHYRTGTELSSVNPLIENLLGNKVVINFFKREIYSEKLRHMILHGRNIYKKKIRYINEDISTKLFLFLLVLYSELDK